MPHRGRHDLPPLPARPGVRPPAAPSSLLAWAVVALAVIGVSAARGGQMSDAFEIPGVESQQAYDVLEADFPAAAGTSAQLVFAAGGDGTLADPPAATAVDAALAEVADQPHVGEVGELRLSDDGRIGYVDVQYDRPSEGIREDAFARLEATQEAADATGAVRMELGGDLPTEAVQEEPGGQESSASSWPSSCCSSRSGRSSPWACRSGWPWSAWPPASA